MDAEQLLIKAKSQLTIKHPYFGMIASRLKHESSQKLDTYASNGKRFLYNPFFIQERTLEELLFILTNCVMHHVLSHNQRKLNRKGYLWQLATDFAINSILHKNGLKIPEGANFNKEYKNMYAEEIYEEIKDQYTQEQIDSFDTENSEQKSKQTDQSKQRSNIFRNFNKIDEEIDENDALEWEYAASLAKEVAKQRSSTPLGLERFAKKIKPQDVDWKFELYNAINRHMRNNYSFMPPNKKHIHRGIALPSLTSYTLSLCVAIDTSGSINDELLGAFMAEFKTIMQNFPAIAIELIIADAKVHAHYSFQGGEDMDFALKGGGGTDYRPVFEYIDGNLPMCNMVLYFTDGDGIFPKIQPNYEILWALSHTAKVPYGRKLVIFK